MRRPARKPSVKRNYDSSNASKSCFYNNKKNWNAKNNVNVKRRSERRQQLLPPPRLLSKPSASPLKRKSDNARKKRKRRRPSSLPSSRLSRRSSNERPLNNVNRPITPAPAVPVIRRTRKRARARVVISIARSASGQARSIWPRLCRRQKIKKSNSRSRKRMMM